MKNITVILSYAELERIVEESPTMRVVLGCQDELANVYNLFLSNNKITKLGTTHRICFIKHLREQCLTNKILRKEIKERGVGFVRIETTPFENLTIAGAKQIVDELP